jgi:CHAT domain-containing protein
VAALIWPQTDKFVLGAITELERAVRKDPEDAHLRSDLAGSLYVLAQQNDEPEALIRALAAADEAVRLAPDLPEALFNRALVLERLYLIDGAHQAWDQFLRLDATSGWADEARERRAALEQPSLPELWKKRLPDLRAAALRGDEREVGEIVALSPQAAREYALEDLLGEWGDLVIHSRGVDAEVPLKVARATGKALLAETGEPSIAEIVGAIDRSVGRPEIAVLASGHQAYREGQRSYRDQLLGKASPLLQEAHRALGRGKSPAVAWALISLAGVDLLTSKYSEALDKYKAALVVARQVDSRPLAGCAAWGIGLIRVRQGRFSESLSQFQAAASAFEVGHEWKNLGAVQQIFAENLRFIGQKTVAWEHRYRALKALSSSRDSLRLHNVLWEGGWASVENGEPRAGLDLLDECVRLGTRSKSPQRLAEALLWRSKARLALNDGSAALGDLQQAQVVNRRTPDLITRERIAADLNYVEGEVRRRTDPEAALGPLSQATAFYRVRELYLDLAGAHLARFRAAMAAGQEEQAEQDLEEALQLFESRRDSLSDSSFRLSAAETAQSLYDEMLLLRAKREGSLSALTVAERARGGLVGPIEELSAAIPRDLAVLEYARAGDRLFIWLLYNGRIESSMQIVPPGELERRVRDFVAAIKRRELAEHLDPIAKELYRLLIPGAVTVLPAGIELVFVPDKSLNELPFAALKDPVTGRFLVEQRTLRISLGVAVGRKRSPALSTAKSALLVAATEFDRTLFANLEPLPGAETEVHALKELYQSAGHVLLGTAATKGNLLRDLGDREVLHFAGHAVFNSRYPDQSYLLLAPTQEAGDAGMLFMHEIERQHLMNLRLVVLSACNTLGPLDTRTGGISGLARSFLKAGADAVVGSLWAVEDQAAARILPDFHRRYLANGDAPAALAGAQRQMLQSSDPVLAHPASWGFLQTVSSSLKGD